MGFFSKLLGIDEGEKKIAQEMIQYMETFLEFSSSSEVFETFSKLGGPELRRNGEYLTGEFGSSTNPNIAYRVEFNGYKKEIRLYFIQQLSGICLEAYLVADNANKEIHTSLYDEKDLIGSQLGIVNAWLQNGIRRKVYR